MICQNSVETPATKSRAAFSPVELLVVVGMIGILAALILGALSKSKKSAGITVCLNNARMITMSLLISSWASREYFVSF